MKEIKSFSVYREYYELITLLSEKEQGEILLAIVKYMFLDEKPVLNAKQKKIFLNLQRPLDKSKNKSNIISKENQNETKKTSKENQNETKTKTHHDVNVNVNNNINNNNIYSYIETNFGRTLSPIEYEVVSNWNDTELTRYAIKQAVLNRAYSIKYIEAILTNFEKKGIKTVVEAEANDKSIKNKSPEWIDKEIKEARATEEEIKKLEERMKR